jgi:serine/threonine protein kinase
LDLDLDLMTTTTTAELVNQGAYGCLYHPGMECSGKTMDDRRYATKLVVQDEVAENEVAVGDIVKGIVNYGVNFVPVIDTCIVNLEKVHRNNPHALNKCDIVPNPKKGKEKGKEKDKKKDKKKGKEKFMLMKMPYIDSLYFYEYISAMRDNKKKIISCIFDTYSYLIESIERLVENEVVHYDLKMQNILMNLKTDTPIIIDFGLSIPIKRLSEGDRFWTTYFYKFSPEYYVWPLEAHVINFLQNTSQKPLSLSRDNVTSICETFVNANAALRIFSKGFRARYLKVCIEQCTQWIGVECDVACVALLKGWPTWDNYSLSIAYLQILGFIYETGFTNNHLIIQYVQLLLMNVHPDPARRKTVGDTKSAFTDLFYMNETVETYDSLVKNFNTDFFTQTTIVLSRDSHP